MTSPPASTFPPAPPSATLRFDLIAGLTAAAVVLPKAMAYGTIAGLPVEVASLKVSLAKVPVGTVTVEGYVPMTGDTPYILEFTPLGPEGGSATVTWTYFRAP